MGTEVSEGETMRRATGSYQSRQVHTSTFWLMRDINYRKLNLGSPVYKMGARGGSVG